MLAQETQGIRLTRPQGRKGKLLDANNPLVMRYIQNINDKPQRKRTTEEKNIKSENTLRKLQAQAEKLHLENIAFREKYISTEAAYKIFDKMFEIELKVFADFGDRVLNKIEKDMECTITPDSRKKAKELLNQTIQDVYIMSARIVSDFINLQSRYMPRKKQPPSEKPEVLHGDWSAIKAELQEQKEQGLADRVQIKVETIRGDLVLRNAVYKTFGDVFSVYRTRVTEIDNSIGDVIAALLSIPNQSHKARNIISSFSYEMIGNIKKKLETFI